MSVSNFLVDTLEQGSECRRSAHLSTVWCAFPCPILSLHEPQNTAGLPRAQASKKVNERNSRWESPKPLFYTIEEQAGINSRGYFSADCCFPSKVYREQGEATWMDLSSTSGSENQTFKVDGNGWLPQLWVK